MVAIAKFIAVAALAVPALAQNTPGCIVEIVSSENNNRVFATGCVPRGGEAWVRGEVNLRVRASRSCGIDAVDANGQIFQPGNVSLRSKGQGFC